MLPKNSDLPGFFKIFKLEVVEISEFVGKLPYGLRGDNLRLVIGMSNRTGSCGVQD